MVKLLFAAALAALVSPAFSADMDINVSVGQPGFYGRLDIGDYPPPQLIYRRPVIIEPVGYNRPPIYLRVPPGEARNWRRHCVFYDACGERVYFVQDGWYQREYMPRYQQRHGGRRDHDGRDDRRRDHYDNRNDRGNRHDR